jgi:hypothetical protein
VKQPQRQHRQNEAKGNLKYSVMTERAPAAFFAPWQSASDDCTLTSWPPTARLSSPSWHRKATRPRLGAVAAEVADAVLGVLSAADRPSRGDVPGPDFRQRSCAAEPSCEATVGL